ncbi:putative reverse transcriptase domain-containing protein [Tanacetum coccineum]
MSITTTTTRIKTQGHAMNLVTPDTSRRIAQKLKNRGNGNGNGVAQGRAYAWRRDASPTLTSPRVRFLLNNRYATTLFDTGADWSFVSTTFSALIDITPTTLENHYDVELADGKIIRVNTIIRGCTLNFMNHPFNIDLMPVPLGSFDVIIGMDWLTKYHGVIICDEKIHKSICQRDVMSFWHTLPRRKPKTSRRGKRLEDVPIVRDFPEVFPEDLSGIPPAQQVAFQIDLVPGAAPVARAPYIGLATIRNERIGETTSRTIRQRLYKTQLFTLGSPSFISTLKCKRAKIAKSMTKLTQKNMKFDWGEKKETAFQLIKQKLCSAPILALPKGSENFIVYCDASHKGLGVMLMQNEKVIAYAS